MNSCVYTERLLPLIDHTENAMTIYIDYQLDAPIIIYS